MAKKDNQACCEKFKTMIGGQALIEGIMMRGPKKDAIVVRGKDGLTVEVSDRKLNDPKSFKSKPFFRGIFNFFDSQVVGVKASCGLPIWHPRNMPRSPPSWICGWRRNWVMRNSRRQW